MKSCKLCICSTFLHECSYAFSNHLPGQKQSHIDYTCLSCWFLIAASSFRMNSTHPVMCGELLGTKLSCNECLQNSWEKLKRSNRFVTAELQRKLKMPHFDHFPRPGEIDPYAIRARWFSNIQNEILSYHFMGNVEIFWIRPTVPEYLGIFSSIWPQHKEMDVKVIWLDLTGDYESFDRLSGSIFVEKHKTTAFFCT